MFIHISIVLFCFVLFFSLLVVDSQLEIFGLLGVYIDRQVNARSHRKIVACGLASQVSLPRPAVLLREGSPGTRERQKSSLIIRWLRVKLKRF